MMINVPEVGGAKPNIFDAFLSGGGAIKLVTWLLVRYDPRAPDPRASLGGAARGGCGAMGGSS